MTARSYLFVPGNRPDRFAKAFASGADQVVLDLEDAVAPEDKAQARDAVVAWALAAPPEELARAVVRINDVSSAWHGEDLRVLRNAPLQAAMLPKAETREQVAALRAAVPALRVLALLETARGIANADKVAVAPGVTRLVFGTLDYALDLDLDLTADEEPLAHAAGCLVVASRAAGLDAPVAGVTPQLDDTVRLLADWAWARRRGFGAKLCIHPAQVAPVHQAMAPSPEDIAWAREVLAADASSPGAVRLRGRMVDLPVVQRARRVLQRAGD
jgi:citrate lyase subunit beta/citryl-CoA lyase